MIKCRYNNIVNDLSTDIHQVAFSTVRVEDESLRGTESCRVLEKSHQIASANWHLRLLAHMQRCLGAKGIVYPYMITEVSHIHHAGLIQFVGMLTLHPLFEVSKHSLQRGLEYL